MTTRKAWAILSIVGLGLALALLSHASSAAASKSGRGLSPAESATTIGGSLCDNYQCDNGNGCVDFGEYWITWYPKYICDHNLYGTCNPIAYNGWCWYKSYYDSLGCPNPAYRNSSKDVTSYINYCGLG